MRFGGGETPADQFTPAVPRGRLPGDWKFRTPRQQAELRQARRDLRAALISDAARAWADLIDADLGAAPPLDAADAWWQRADAALALAIQYGYGGALGRIASDYAEHCRRTAAAAAPARYGTAAERQAVTATASVPVRDLLQAAIDIAQLHGISLQTAPAAAIDVDARRVDDA